mgnify:FL=1
MTTNDFFREDDTVAFHNFIPPQPYIIYTAIRRRKFPKGAKTVDVRTDEKISRNAPCPCGSGLKFKKCHMK